MLFRFYLPGILVVATAMSGGSLRAAPPTAEGIEFFEKRIRPVLVEHCYECHSAAKKAKGGLALDTRAAVLKGGESGEVLVPGDPEKSRLIDAVRYKNLDLQMPPKGPLSAAQVRDLETWVTMGAPDPREATPVGTTLPRTIDINEGRKFWSFAPVSNPSQPVVKNGDWVKSPIDAFILAELEKRGLAPAPPADKRTLLRRVTFDLTGLPPTPGEVAEFVADDSVDAFDRVVERLLSSPHYGERWGRHWLDVARYADTNGLDENIAYGHSWRYRDYVVNAFNTDKPFDQFLIEQLAGDLLPVASEAQRIENLTATGFLAIGARVLAEPDVRKLEMDIIDEQLDTLGKAFLGMTVGCCRCHDHKFDPLPTADYYSLAAIFRSTRSLSVEKMGAVKFWYEHSLATPEQLEAKKQHEAVVTKQREALTKFTNEQRTKLKDELQARAADYLAAAAELPADASFAKVNQLAEERGLRPRYLLTCRQYLALNSEHPVFARWRELFAARQPNAVREHYSKLFTDAAAALKEAKAKDEKATKPADESLAAALESLQEKAGFLTIPDWDADAFDAEVLTVVNRLRGELKATEDQTPEPPALMGVADGTITNTLPIHIRGSYLSLGKEVERGFPEVMRTSMASQILPSKQSGRLQLARWMAGSDHPLTSRVMVNRLWRWHFGAGLVRTTENFGILGDKPSHPELLDWLARHFVEEGWSVKEMHRLLLRSSTYQMASVNHSVSPSHDPAQIDPDNRLLSRANIQRLEAEQIADALFAVSGSLNEQIGGKTIPLRNRQYVFDHTSIDATRYESTRRALYLPLIRNHLYDLLEQFDYPDPTAPTGSRNATVVAPQALILLNAPVVREAAERLAKLLLEINDDDLALVDQAYVTLYARPPTERERARAAAFLNSQSDRNAAWILLCHTLLAANEFLYLR